MKIWVTYQYIACNLRHSHSIQRTSTFASFSIWEVLGADLVEGSSVELGAELVGVLWGGAESALQGGILASGDEAIVVDVLDVEDLLDGLEAGGSVGLGGEDWEGGGVGGLCDYSLLEVALESVVETEELVGEDRSSHGDGGEDDVSIHSGAEVVSDIKLSGGSRSIFVAAGLVCSLLLGLVVVVVEEGDELIGALTKSVPRDQY